MPNINLSPITAEQAAIQRRQKMAEALQQQAQQPLEMPTTAGVQISPLAGLTKVLQGYMGGRAEQQALAEQKKYESDYLSDVGFLLRNANKNEPATAAVPEQTISTTEPNVANQNLTAVALRQAMRDPNATVNPFERQIGVDERAQISKLPMESTQTTVTPAIPARPAVPFLSAALLSPDNAKDDIKTSAGKTLLAQYLMQQQEQQQAAALRKQEAEQAIVKFGPEDTAGRIVDGKFVPLVTGKPKIEYTKVETRDPVTGQKIVKYVDKTKLGELGDVLAPYTGMIDHLMQAQNLPEVIKNNPDALRLVGGFLGKEGGDVTSADFAKVMISLDETNARLRNEGISPVSTNIVKRKNIMIQSKPLPPKGSSLENGQVYDTPKGQARWDGTKLITID